MGADPVGSSGWVPTRKRKARSGREVWARPRRKFGLGGDPGGSSGLVAYVAPQDVGPVVELYGQVAWSLQLVEEAVAGWRIWSRGL